VENVKPSIAAALILAGCTNVTPPCKEDVTALTGPGWGSTTWARCSDIRQTLVLETISNVVVARCVCAKPAGDGGAQ
jgi:hypothetical protein